MRALIRVLAAMTVVVVSASPAFAGPWRFPPLLQDGFAVPPLPSVEAISWILYDGATDTVLREGNADVVRAPASITKIMTVLLALERGDQDDLVTISQRAANTGEREIGLVAGEQVRLGALTRAALIHSANDAATAIAEHIGGSVDGFSALMNERAVELGMTRTNFANPHGLDAPGHVTSARDMLRLAVAAMSRQDFRDISRSRIVVFPDAPDGTRRIGTSTNLLLDDYEGSNGIKTGFTSQALLTYVATANRDGRELYAVVLGSEGRRTHFDVAETLFDHGFGDLAIYGALVGQPYVSPRLRVEPGPLTLTAQIEATVHVAAEGLLSEAPEPPIDLPDLPPPAVETVRRHGEGGASDVWGALWYWFGPLLGP
ncbi:MAG: D-alanyl-D-alanine carboxypeptidase [Actinobacteria bacterium]|nr:D-alanyl-D-alanine carboxypeptidase [Actinomycetota bacterium]